jgi:hypothetical protein
MSLLMQGGQFASRQEAIDGANEKFRSKFGNDIEFPDGNEGSRLNNAVGDAWKFRVANPFGKEELGHYVVRCISEGVFWLGISCQVKLLSSAVQMRTIAV